MSPLKNLPLQDRPRERLQRLGPSALSTVELLAILLGSGTQKRSVLHLAADLLSHFQTVEALFHASLEELLQIPGIGPAKALQLQAAFALALRKEDPLKAKITSTEQLYHTLRQDIEQESAEVLLVAALDVRSQILHKEVVAKGIVSEVLLHPREVYRTAIKHCAYALVIAHNHPTGDPTPSRADLDITHILTSSGKLLGIPLLDHLIIGNKCYYSFAEQGLLPGISGLLPTKSILPFQESTC